MTDTGLAHLKGLSNLQWLNLVGTQVTDEGVRDLRRALPNCKAITEEQAVAEIEKLGGRVRVDKAGSVLTVRLGGRQYADIGLAHLKPNAL